MAGRSAQSRPREFWELVRAQHGVIARSQLLELGFTAKAIEHRLAVGKLHRLWRGVYAVGRPGVTQEGLWMAATLACGAAAVLSHESAAQLWRLRRRATTQTIEISVPLPALPRFPGIVAHRRSALRDEDVTRRDGIPVTTPECTLVDLACRLRRSDLEAALNEADTRGLIAPPRLRAMLEQTPSRPGVGALRTILDRRTFAMTRSELERRFLPIAREVGLPRPETRKYVNGFEVDFFWPDLGLVVETDGLRYHRTPAQQARDRRRDQAHTAAGLVPLRFTHEQVRYEPRYVRATLGAVAARLRS